MSHSPLLVHVQNMLSLKTMLNVVHCASYTVVQVLEGTSEATCVSSTASQDAFSTVSKGASCSFCCASGQRQDLGREQSFEVESSGTSSEGLRASGQLQKANQGQWTSGPRADRRATPAYSGRPAAPRPASAGSGSDLDISCLVDNTPFKINEVCCTASWPWLAAEVTLATNNLIGLNLLQQTGMCQKHCARIQNSAAAKDH